MVGDPPSPKRGRSSRLGSESFYDAAAPFFPRIVSDFGEVDRDGSRKASLGLVV